MSNKEKGTGERIVGGLADAAMAPLNAGSGMAMGLIGGPLIVTIQVMQGLVASMGCRAARCVAR